MRGSGLAKASFVAVLSIVLLFVPAAILMTIAAFRQERVPSTTV
jgi:hypothetical protein